MVGGFCVVSREVIKVALRDERRYLRALGQEGEEGEEEAATLYPDGFSVEALLDAMNGYLKCRRNHLGKL